MSIVTGQQINDYYNRFRKVDITFNQSVIQGIGLQTKQVYFKAAGKSIPCVIYSTSMIGAKILANIDETFFSQIKKDSKLVQIRYSFRHSDKEDPITFFISCKINGYTPYNGSQGALYIVTLEYTQRPPDDLIQILGELIEANANMKHRSEERIMITAETIRKMGLKSKNAYVIVGKTALRCIMRDVSFSGSKVLILGKAKSLINQPVMLRYELDTGKVISILGKFIRHEPVEGREDIAAMAIVFDSSRIPVSHKLLINDFIKTKKQGDSGKASASQAKKPDQAPQEGQDKTVPPPDQK